MLPNQDNFNTSDFSLHIRIYRKSAIHSLPHSNVNSWITEDLTQHLKQKALPQPEGWKQRSKVRTDLLTFQLTGMNTSYQTRDIVCDVSTNSRWHFVDQY